MVKDDPYWWPLLALAGVLYGIYDFFREDK